MANNKNKGEGNMTKPEKKKFKETHLMLITEVGKSVERARQAYAAKVQKFQQMMNTVAIELGIPEADLDNWKISEDGKHFERKEEKVILKPS